MESKLDSPIFKVLISGDRACFTRPEMKVERVSYEVITPSAARGVLEAILWKPAIRWVITRIYVLKPIQWFSIQRNEVTDKISTRTVQAAMQGGVLEPLVVDEKRAQRHTLGLRDVAYVIEAGFALTKNAGPDDNSIKFRDMFERRVQKGQCYRRPYLGCREFAAEFGPAPTNLKSISETKDLGWMLYDIEFGEDQNTPHFFFARMDNGVVDVQAPASWPQPTEAVR